MKWTRLPVTCRGVARALRAALIIAAVAGFAIGAGLTVWLAVLNEWGAGRDALLLLVQLAGLYTAASLVVTLGVTVAGSCFGRPPSARTQIGCLVGFYLLLNGALRFAQAVQFVSITPHMTLTGLFDIVLVLAAAIAAGLGIATRRSAAGLATAAAIWVALWSVSTVLERPPRSDLARRVPAALANSVAVANPAKSAQRLDDVELLVIGFDGLAWDVLLPLVERGEMPNFSALLSDAAYGYLDTLDFTVSPVVWETISSGMPPERHGIGYHQHFEFAGTSQRIRRLPYYPLCNTPMGIRRLLAATSRFAPWKQVPSDATDARSARIWEIASDSGRRVGVYGWLNTSPASSINGFIHGYEPVSPRNYPRDLEEDLEPIDRHPPAPKPGLDWMNGILDFERVSYRRFIALAERHPAQVLMFYTHVGDAANHLNWKQDTVGDGIFHVGLSIPDVNPGPATTQANRFLDEVLGDLLSRIPESARVVIVSDHGFEFRGYEHDNAPPGVFIARGPGIQPGPLPDASIEDVTPTLLHLLGLPIGSDMTGRVIPMARAGAELDREPEFIDSYGGAALAEADEEFDADALKEHEEYLRALGYVN